MKNKSSDVKTINFNSVPIRDMSGNKILRLSGNFEVKQLSDYLIETWVAYIECHGCPRSDSCVYTIPHPIYDHKKKEIRCGVKSKFIENMIKAIFHEFDTSDKTKQENLLSGVYFLAEFVYKTEQHIGMSLSDNSISFFEDYTPTMMASIIHLREYLNKAASNFKLVKPLYYKKPILLVEGQSEKFFVEKLKESGYAWFNDLRVETYGGNGNAQPKRIQMLIDGYNDIGYMCFMQGDKDGKAESTAFNKLITQKSISEKSVFLFKYDFESSIPKNLLLRVIQDLGFLLGVDKSEFIARMNVEQSVCKTLEKEYSFNIESYKIKLADKLGFIINTTNFGWYQNEDKFMENTELGQFLDFIIQMYKKV